MTEHQMAGRPGDPGLKWVILGGVAGVGTFLIFLAALADQLRFTDPGAVPAVAIMGLAGAAGFAALALGPVGRAMAKRIVGSDQSVTAQIDGELQDMRLQVEDLRQALTETHDRLDFTERLLAGGEKRT